MHNSLSIPALDNATMSLIGGRSANSKDTWSAKVGWKLVWHRHGNWEQMEVMTLIKCKYIEHVIQKQMPRNGTMCKDKWTGINSDFKKLSDYHKGTEHHTLYWELSTNKCDNHHLPWSFNTKYYNAIEAFQGECIINTPLHDYIWLFKIIIVEFTSSQVKFPIHQQVSCYICRRSFWNVNAFDGAYFSSTILESTFDLFLKFFVSSNSTWMSLSSIIVLSLSLKSSIANLYICPKSV